MKATLVSILPYPIFSEHKPGVVPSEVRLPAAKADDIEIKVIGDAITHDYLDSERGYRERRIPADEMAESITFDYWSHLVHVDAACRPGFFWVAGDLTKERVKKEYADLIEEMRETQNSWFKRIVQIADDDWTHNRAHRMITDQQRYAAKALGLEREWLFAPEDVKTTSCPACSSRVSSEAAICQFCNAVLNEEKAKKFRFIGGNSSLPASVTTVGK